ncbi:MAG: hypothetical protein A2W25_08750 [candidate division Zixibacteria bacterium RBG_16_53_22]|nr:MAG: hypothetical protein A2W25_08750 [candidate division Zixibacteria bacterium RBG_16_53_22]
MPLTVIILVYNEEKNIERCLKSIHGWVRDIFVVDSYSTDRTLAIVEKYTDKIYQREFESFANKFNWALTYLPVKTNWIMRLDADEIVIDPEYFFVELKAKLEKDSNVAGCYVNQRFYFLNHWIRHGGYPRKVLRIWRTGSAHFENRLLDEKMHINGIIDYLDIDIADIRQNGVSYWFNKHVQYARLEAIEADRLNKCECVYRDGLDKISYKNKQKYYKAPIYIRPFIYFIYRLFYLKGYKDGIIGVFYHFLHGFVYREMVDFNIHKNKLRNLLK